MISQFKPNSGDKLFFWSESKSGKHSKPRSGELKAKSESHARFLLRKQGVQPTQLKRVRATLPKKVPIKVVAAFVRQLSVMIQSGVPLGQSLGLISANFSGSQFRGIREVVRTIRGDVESGVRLSDAMRKHPGCFDSIFCSTLSAGEDSGELDAVLFRLANHLEKVIRTRQRIKKAMTYPAIVIVVALAVSVGLLAFVIPTFKTVYTSFKAELPGLTTTLLALSDLITQYGFECLAVVMAVVFAIRMTYKQVPAFRHGVDRILLRAPIVGTLLQTAVFARWARTFSTLSASGVPIVGALDSVAQVTGYKQYTEATLQIKQNVATGQGVSDSMEKTGLFSPEATQMIRIGEESGRMDSMLDRLATQYENRLDDLVDNLSTVMEPTVMCVIGALVGVLIVGMYMPIFQLGGIV